MKIELNNLTFSYKKNNAPLLNGINTVLESGKRYILIGQNGCGKTTLANLILGLLKPISGSIFIDGMDAKKMSVGSRATKIGYLFQNPDYQLFAPTVLEELTFPYELTNTLTPSKQQEIQNLLSQFGLLDAQTRFPLTMSGGEKQKLALACLLSTNAEFLIMDEPTSALDSDSREFLISFINSYKGGILIITHDDSLISSVANPKVIRLEGGALYET